MNHRFKLNRDAAQIQVVPKYINHPYCNHATLFQIGGKGLCVIQQHFNTLSKTTYWGTIESSVANDICTHPKFKAYFDKYASEKSADGYFPIVNVRSLMWALRMKPLPKASWEEWKGDLWTKTK